MKTIDSVRVEVLRENLEEVMEGCKMDKDVYVDLLSILDNYIMGYIIVGGHVLEDGETIAGRLRKSS